MRLATTFAILSLGTAAIALPAPSGDSSDLVESVPVPAPALHEIPVAHRNPSESGRDDAFFGEESYFNSTSELESRVPKKTLYEDPKPGNEEFKTIYFGYKGSKTGEGNWIVWPKGANECETLQETQGTRVLNDEWESPCKNTWKYSASDQAMKPELKLTGCFQPGEADGKHYRPQYVKDMDANKIILRCWPFEQHAKTGCVGSRVTTMGHCVKEGL